MFLLSVSWRIVGYYATSTDRKKLLLKLLFKKYDEILLDFSNINSPKKENR